MKEEMVRFRNVTMTSNGETYLDNINFYILKGEIMGFISSGGKGRDELIDLLQKNTPLSYGEIFIDGKQVNSYLHSPGDRNKVYRIGKKSGLIDSLSVADNVFVVRRGFKKFVIREAVLKEQVLRLSEELGIRIDPDKELTQFTPMERCEAEILKAYMLGCKLIVLTDLSAFMSRRELGIFWERLRGLAKRGITFLYVCNHHEEAFQISDRVSFYSNGRIKKIFEKTEMTNEAIKPYIMDFNTYHSEKRNYEGEKELEFKEVCSKHMTGLSFSVKKGECLTILDTDSVAAEEIAKILSGEEKCSSGQILFEKKPYEPSPGIDFLKEGIALIPEHPTKNYLFPDQTYMENLTFLLDRKLGKNILKKAYLKSIRKEYKERAMGGIDETDIRKLNLRQKYGLVYYRIFLYHPRLAVLVQPVAHGDMLCRRYILDRIQELKDAGITVLILANSISDHLYISDRLLVLKNQKFLLELEAEEFSLVRR